MHCSLLTLLFWKITLLWRYVILRMTNIDVNLHHVFHLHCFNILLNNTIYLRTVLWGVHCCVTKEQMIWLVLNIFNDVRAYFYESNTNASLLFTFLIGQSPVLAVSLLIWVYTSKLAYEFISEPFGTCFICLRLVKNRFLAFFLEKETFDLVEAVLTFVYL